MLANKIDPDKMPHYVASDLGLHCLPVILLRVSGKNGLMNGENIGVLPETVYVIFSGVLASITLSPLLLTNYAHTTITAYGWRFKKVKYSKLY